MAKVLKESGSKLASEYEADIAKKDALGSTTAEKNYGNDVESVDFTEVWELYHTEAERKGTSTGNFIEWVRECLK